MVIQLNGFHLHHDIKGANPLQTGDHSQLYEICFFFKLAAGTNTGHTSEPFPPDIIKPKLEHHSHVLKIYAYMA